MKESAGAVSAIYVVIFFVIIMFGFIISVLSYYKSYKINNRLTAIIEDYGGFNSLSKEEIEKSLASYGYTRSNVTCKAKDDELLVKADGTTFEDDRKTADSNELGYKGYCVYLIDDTPNPEEGKTKIEHEYYSYKVTTSLVLDFGLLNFRVPYQMSSHTSAMYSCYGGNLNCPDID